MSYIYNLTDTWNAAGTTFSGIKMAVTNTASSASSMLLDLSVSGATAASFTVNKTGDAALSGGLTLGTALSVANGGTGFQSLNAGYIPFGAGTSAFGSSSKLFWDNTNSRLGIGTSSPSAALSITMNSSSFADNIYLLNTATAAGSWARMAFQSGTNYGYAAMTEGGNFYFYNANNSIIFGAGNAECARMTADKNFGIGTSSFGTSAARVLAIANGTAPTTSPAGIGQLYVESGALKYRGSSGTVTTIANA